MSDKKVLKFELELSDKLIENLVSQIVKKGGYKFINALSNSLKVISNDENMERVYTVKEASKLLNVSINTLRTHCLKGIIESTKDGKSYRISQSSLNEYHAKRSK